MIPGTAASPARQSNPTRLPVTGIPGGRNTRHINLLVGVGEFPARAGGIPALPRRGRSLIEREKPLRTLVRAVEVEKAGETVSVLADCAEGGGGR